MGGTTVTGHGASRDAEPRGSQRLLGGPRCPSWKPPAAPPDAVPSTAVAHPRRGNGLSPSNLCAYTPSTLQDRVTRSRPTSLSLQTIRDSSRMPHTCTCTCGKSQPPELWGPGSARRGFLECGRALHSD